MHGKSRRLVYFAQVPLHTVHPRPRSTASCHLRVRRLSALCLALQIPAFFQQRAHCIPPRWRLDESLVACTSDNALTFARRSHDMPVLESDESKIMLIAEATRHSLARCAIPALLAFCMASIGSAAQDGQGQNVPLISGGVGFVTSTNGGNTTYIPVISPVLAAPIGSHVLVESRAIILDPFSPNGDGKAGYKGNLFMGLTYLQADLLASRHVTVVAGEFLTPFATYNERLSPIWIGNFQDAPLTFGVGTMETASSVGGMLRGSAFATDHVSADYAVYFSAASTNQQFTAERASGGRGSLYFPTAHLEVGASYGRQLQNVHENFEGFHVWWEPPSTALRLRSEYARGAHADGYWVEADYRLSRFNGGESFVGRFEPVFRMQQTFRSQPDSNDGLPSANTQQADFGLDYRLPHEVRINTSYSREFSSTGNRNIWQTGIVYRFLFPTWRGK